MSEMKPQHEHRRGFFFPMLLIAIGVFLFLTNTGVVEGSAWSLFSTYWPVLIILMGLDGYIKQEGWVWPTFLLGLGTLLLLGNLNLLPISAGQMLLRFWPILLVALGLDIAFGRRGSAGSVIARLFLGLLLIAAIFFLAFFAVDQNLVTESLSAKLEGTPNRIELVVEQPVGRQVIEAGQPGMPEVYTASIRRLEGETLESSSAVSGGVLSAHVRAQQPVVGSWRTTNNTQRWEFTVSPDYPLDLTAKLGVGEQDLDLTGTKADNLEIETAVGRMVVRLPETELEGELSLAIGEIVVYVPKGAAVRIDREGGISATNLPSGWNNQDGIITSPSAGSAPLIELKIEQAIGSVQVRELP